MGAEAITDKDRGLAQKCMECSACSHAREKQGGIVFWFVRAIENSICTYCKAYERVYGRKAHEPMPDKENLKVLGNLPTEDDLGKG